MDEGKKYFNVNVEKYFPELDFEVVRPASLNNPKNNAVMFVTAQYINHAIVLYSVNNCLIFWPDTVNVPEEIVKRHAVYICDNPHLQYCKFYMENNITYYPPVEEFDVINGAYIAKQARIGKNVKIFPGAYIGGEVEIGDNVYIGSGVKLIGEIYIGNNVIIRENTVIGADGLTTDRDEKGRAVTMPQFGSVILENDVHVGANTVIARGAIDSTVVHRGAKVDNSCFISHNVQIGADTFIVGETIMMGSTSTGEQVFISGNSTIRNGIHIGSRSTVGMASAVVKQVAEDVIVKGNPAK